MFWTVWIIYICRLSRSTIIVMCLLWLKYYLAISALSATDSHTTMTTLPDDTYQSTSSYTSSSGYGTQTQESCTVQGKLYCKHVLLFCFMTVVHISIKFCRCQDGFSWNFFKWFLMLFDTSYLCVGANNVFLNLYVI